MRLEKELQRLDEEDAKNHAFSLLRLDEDKNEQRAQVLMEIDRALEKYGKIMAGKKDKRTLSSLLISQTTCYRELSGLWARLNHMINASNKLKIQQKDISRKERMNISKIAVTYCMPVILGRENLEKLLRFLTP